MQRVATALVLAPLFIGLVWYGSAQAFMALMLAAGAVCLVEYARMAQAKGITIYMVPALATVLLLPVAITMGMAVTFSLMFIAVLILFVLSFPDVDRGVERLGFTMLGIFYVGLTIAGAILLRNLPDGQKLFLLVCCGVWGSDSTAYYAGRAFGKTKLAPAVSPGKTVEGAAGGVVGSVLLCAIFMQFFYKEAAIEDVVSAAIIGAVIGPIGDLAESKLKRYFGVKDSGNILPGHGGILDRADALLFAAPAYYIYFVLKGMIA